jgi:hypothetical protein
VRFLATGRYHVAPAYIDLLAGVESANGAGISKVEFFAGEQLVATASTEPYIVTWRNVQAGTYSLTAKVTDGAGAVAISAPFALTVGASPALTVASGLDGMTVAHDRISVTGTVDAPPNSAVDVNGVFGTVTTDGKFMVENVPLTVGSNNLVARVTTMDAVTATAAVTVTSTGAAPFSFDAIESYGVQSLETSFSVRQNDAASGSRFVLYCVEGQSSFEAATIEGIALHKCTYPVGGPYVAKLDVFGAGGEQLHTETQRIYVEAAEQVGRTVRSVYSTVIGRLMDSSSATALHGFDAGVREKYEAMFTAIGANLSAAASSFGNIKGLSVGNSLAHLVVLRPGPDGAEAFYIHLYFGNDRIWRIESM